MLTDFDAIGFWIFSLKIVSFASVTSKKADYRSKSFGFDVVELLKVSSETGIANFDRALFCTVYKHSFLGKLEKERF